MTQDGMPTYAELNDEVRRLRDRLALLEAPASAPSTLVPDAQALFQLVIDHLPQSICWKDHNSVFLGCNLSFARSLGMKQPSDLIGKSDYDVTSAELADAYAADDRLVMEGGGRTWSVVHSGSLEQLRRSVLARGGEVVESRDATLEEIFLARAGRSRQSVEAA